MTAERMFSRLDSITKNHCERVKNLSIQVALKGRLPENDLKMIGLAAQYHDIGKLMVSDKVLNKKGKLTTAEFLEIKKHTLFGEQLMAPYFNNTVCSIIKYHHENEDGTGYYSLKGDKIPICSKIIHICDVFDALVNDRPYKKGWEKTKAVQFIKDNSGDMFDIKWSQFFLQTIKKAG